MRLRTTGEWHGQIDEEGRQGIEGREEGLLMIDPRTGRDDRFLPGWWILPLATAGVAIYGLAALGVRELLQMLH
jgi:hypothetical protein